MKTQNEGIRTYQESKRQEKLSKIDEAYQYLKESHLSITKKALSDASGIPLRTIHQPYVQQHLLHSVSCDSTGTITALENEVKRLKCLLSKSRNDNNRLKAENLSLKEECRKLNYEYACVLGDNQKLRENKLIRL